MFFIYSVIWFQSFVPFSYNLDIILLIFCIFRTYFRALKIFNYNFTFKCSSHIWKGFILKCYRSKGRTWIIDVYQWPKFRSPFYVFASKCTAIRKPQNWTKINQTSFRVVLAFDPVTLETIMDVKLYVVLFSLSVRCSGDLNTWNLKTRAIQKPTLY